ncbi:hypothetical protein BV898_15695 [Hypsibius exemplaris]|uniref:Uncharacterized protein n=1 Tax=Hypsibius exemplaris TaxID=2072580 RepID=A0A9X6RL02_HYPEX|nr:hypothetical protein BV898_15695 [Hypsibius exemplaris]
MEVAKMSVAPLFLQMNNDVAVRAIRNSCASSEVRQLDLGCGLASLTYATRNNLLELAGAENRFGLCQALLALRYKLQQQLRCLDLSFRAMDGRLLLHLLGSRTCRARHTRFPSRLDSLCRLSMLGQFSSRVTALDLTGADITPQSLNQLLKLCPHLEYLSLEGLRLQDSVFQLKDKLLDLQVLNLTACAGLRDESCVRVLMETAPNLVNLDLSMSDISQQAMLQVVGLVNDQLEILSVAELGHRFAVEHLTVLGGRCREIRQLDISTTLAAKSLNHAHFLPFPRLAILMANMQLGVTSVIRAETLLAFQSLPALETLYIHRRITMGELKRFAPWNLPFLAVRSHHPRLVDHAGAVCRLATAEPGGSDFPSIQLTHRVHFGGTEPL